MMYEELVKRCRDCIDCLCGECKYKHLQKPGNFVPCMNALLGETADAIEELSANMDIARNIATIIENENDMRVIAKTPRWIPVTERLPNCNGCYLVWRPHFFGGEIGMPSICYFDGSNTWHDSYGVDFERILHPDDVTHWMPLPEPPKDGE